MFDVVVLASGRGSNFAGLLAAQRSGELPIRIRALLSDKADAGALSIARAAGICAIALAPTDFPDRAAFDRILFARVAEFSPNLIVLAGYMRRIEPEAVAPWHGHIVNIHPSLLPKYPGLRTHQRVLDAGDTAHGASVHFVTAELDGGPVIAQCEMPIHVDDTPYTLATRLLPLEHRLLVACVNWIANGRIVLGAHCVEFDGTPLAEPLRLQADGSLSAMCAARP